MFGRMLMTAAFRGTSLLKTPCVTRRFADYAGKSQVGLDWVSRGAVTSVENQGITDTCWAFAAVASVEAVHFLATGKLVKLSPQCLVDCDKKFNSGCLHGGGFVWGAYCFIIQNGGLCSAEDKPFLGIEGECCKVKAPGTGMGLDNQKNMLATIDGFRLLPFCHEKCLVEELKIQPIVVSVDMTGNLDGFKYYKGGIFKAETASERLLRLANRKKSDLHAMLLVGTGTEGGVDYFKLKNSWGPSWGEAGYLRAERNSDGGFFWAY